MSNLEETFYYRVVHHSVQPLKELLDPDTSQVAEQTVPVQQRILEDEAGSVSVYDRATPGHDTEYLAFDHAEYTQRTLAMIREREERCSLGCSALRDAMRSREKRVANIDPEAVRQALYPLLAAPPRTPSLAALAQLAVSVNLNPCIETTIVDDEGNPWTAHILTFLDVFLVLYRTVATTPVSLGSTTNADAHSAKHGVIYDHDQEELEDNEVESKAFGATQATNLSSRLVHLIPYTHHHVLRAMWFALINLSMAYSRTKRGIVVDYMLENVELEWDLRQERAAITGGSAWGKLEAQIRVEEDWFRRSRKVGDMRRILEDSEDESRNWLSSIWEEMKGMTGADHDILKSSTTQEDQLDDSRGACPIHRGGSGCPP